MSSDWTKEDIDKVKAGLAQGHSARRIAMDLGNGRSRNAVIGIIASSAGHRVNIRFDGEQQIVGPLHPTWELRAIESAGGPL